MKQVGSLSAFSTYQLLLKVFHQELISVFRRGRNLFKLAWISLEFVDVLWPLLVPFILVFSFPLLLVNIRLLLFLPLLRVLIVVVTRVSRLKRKPLVLREYKFRIFVSAFLLSLIFLMRIESLMVFSATFWTNGFFAVVRSMF